MVECPYYRCTVRTLGNHCAQTNFLQPCIARNEWCGHLLAGGEQLPSGKLLCAGNLAQCRILADPEFCGVLWARYLSFISHGRRG